MNNFRWWAMRSPFVALAACEVWGIVQYTGNRFIFCFFSVVMFAITYVAIRFRAQYAHFFLGIAWFLGFWMKYLFHQATGASYNELHGSFDGTDASWDAVLLVIGVGGGGYLFGRLVTIPVLDSKISKLLKREISVPLWWISYRKMIWLLAVLLVLLVLAMNQSFGLLVRGYAAKTTLPWPLGGLFAWTTDIGLALLLALLLAWDRQSNSGVVRGFVALCIEGALMSISTLSRGVYFFHTLPPLLTEGTRAYRYGKLRPIVFLFGMWVAIGVAVPSATTFLRLFGQNAVPVTAADLHGSRAADIDRPVLQEKTASMLWSQFVTLTQILVIDRWTGLEGVMATVAYPYKDKALFLEAAAQRRSYGTVDVYTRQVSGSTFTEENAKKYHFATLAGPIAFLYFSGSLVVVFMGMALISVLISAIEILWLWLARDRLLVAMSGLYLALVVLQLSGGLVQSLTGLFAVTGAFAGIRLIGFFQQNDRSVSEIAPFGTLK